MRERGKEKEKEKKEREKEKERVSSKVFERIGQKMRRRSFFFVRVLRLTLTVYGLLKIRMEKRRKMGK